MIAGGSSQLEPFARDMFIREVDRQARFAVQAWGDLQASCKRERIDLDEVWYSLQGFLMAAGIQSLIFWPTARSSQDRGSEMRAAFGMPDDSPLASRVIRNTFAHFDERLEEWAAGGEPNVYGDSSFGPVEHLPVESRNILRHLDPSTWTLFFRGERYQLLPVAREVLRLGGAARDLLKEGDTPVGEPDDRDTAKEPSGE